MNSTAENHPKAQILDYSYKRLFRQSILGITLLFVHFGVSSILVLSLSIYLLLKPTIYTNQNRNDLQNIFSSLPPVLGASSVRHGYGDSRPAAVEQFLARYHSILAPYAGLIVETSLEKGIPWVLLPAIAGQESSFCREGSFPSDSFNCWGWAIHTKYTKKFSSFEEGIGKVASGLSEYYRRLKIDPEAPIEEQVKTIKTLYNSTSKTWDKGVLYFIYELQTFSSK